MKIIIGSDMAGLKLREHLIKYLAEKGHELKDMGTDPEQRVGHPCIAEGATQEFKKGGYDFGILICGTGTGISIAANKVNGIRCALVQNHLSAKIAKELNKANFIAFGGAVTHELEAEAYVDTYMKSTYKTGVDWVEAWDKEIDAIEAKNGYGLTH